MPRPNDVGVGVCGILLKQDSVLLARRKSSHEGGKLAVPGGWIDITDITPLHALSREFKEEVNLDIDIKDIIDRPIITTAIYNGFSCVTIHYVVVFNASFGKPKINEPDKFEDLRFYKLKEIAAMQEEDLFPGLKNVLGMLNVG